MSNYTLHLGDCLEYMRGMDAGSVDAVVTDPPFGIDFKYATHDDAPEKYADMMREFIIQAERITKDGFIFVWQAMKNCDKWHTWFPAGFRIFAGLKNFTQFRPTPIQYSFDPVIFWSIGNPKVKPVAVMRDYHMGNTAKYVAEKSNGHPCPRPLNTVAYIVNMVTDIGATIFDGFAGSGTTGVACMQLGRNFIGCEIDPRYHAIAEKRISQAAAQIILPFGEPVPA